MKIPFRHGLVRHQTDINGNPSFLLRVDGGSYVTLVVSPDPTILTFAHGTDIDYLFEERTTVERAWGPFTPNTDYWLYWDIDILTGLRSFGFTTMEPVASTVAPTNPAVDKHWFDLTAKSMKVWQGTRWIEKIRVFSCKYDEGTQLVPYPLGSQVGLTTPCNSGLMIFDEFDKPIRRIQMDGKGKFYTTETKFVTQTSGIATISFETMVVVAESVDYIPAWSLVRSRGPNKIGLGSHNDITSPLIGMVREDMHAGEVQSYIPQGFVTNPMWNWTEPAGTSLFCGPTGEITTSVPQTGSVQRIGEIVATDMIYLNIQPRLTYV